MSENLNSGPAERVDEHGNVFHPGGWTTIYSLPAPDGGRQVVYPPIFIPPFEGSRIDGDSIPVDNQLPQVEAGVGQLQPPEAHQESSHQV